MPVSVKATVLMHSMKAAMGSMGNAAQVALSHWWDSGQPLPVGVCCAELWGSHPNMSFVWCGKRLSSTVTLSALLQCTGLILPALQVEVASQLAAVQAAVAIV